MSLILLMIQRLVSTSHGHDKSHPPINDSTVVDMEANVTPADLRMTCVVTGALSLSVPPSLSNQ